MIEVESFDQVPDLSSQKNSDQHLRNMRAQIEKTLRDEVVAAWRLSRSLPRWVKDHDEIRLMSVTGAESHLVDLCYWEACRQVQDGINRDSGIDRARSMSAQTTREVGGWLPTA